MSYNIQFKGSFKFNDDITPFEIYKIKSLMGIDIRDSKEIDSNDYDFNYIDLMNTAFPNFTLTGEMISQGEEIGDISFIRNDEDGRIIENIIDLKMLSKIMSNDII